MSLQNYHGLDTIHFWFYNLSVEDLWDKNNVVIVVVMFVGGCVYEQNDW